MISTVRRRTAALALALCLALGLPVTADAAGMESGFDGVSPGEIVYFAGHQWGIIDENGTLLHVSGDVGAAVTTAVEYGDGNLRRRMEEIAERFNPRESSAIVPRTLTAASDDIEGPDVADQKLWPLSYNEAEAVRTNMTSLMIYGAGNPWWLRTPQDWGGGIRLVNNVNQGGNIIMSTPGLEHYARPALYLDTSKVLFTSDAAAGKPGGMGLTQAFPPSSGEYRLTVLDPGLNQLGLTFDEASNGAGSLNFAFSGAATGGNRFVSCVLEQGGEVKYYGKLASGGSGAFTVDTAPVSPGTYTLRLFVEEDNGDYETDFAGTTIDMVLTVTASGATVSDYDTNAYSVFPTTLDLAVGETGSFTVNLGKTGSRADRADIASANPSVASASPTQITQSPGAVTVTGQSAGTTAVTVTFSGGDLATPTQIPVTVKVTGDDPGPGPDPEPDPGPGPGSSTGFGGSSSGGRGSFRSSGGTSASSVPAGKTVIPESAFSWDGRSLTIDYEGITPLGIQKVEWDGAETSAYTARKGSVIVRFDADFIAAQPPGDHTVRVEFLNHTAEATVTVGGVGAADEAGGAGEYDSVADNRNRNPNTGGRPDSPGAQTGSGNGVPWALLLAGAALAAWRKQKLV